MREILFKAKRMDNGEWVEGHFTMNPNNGNAYITSCVSWGAHPDRVDPETVCQWTGLKDRNGVKIFEGDIVTHDTKSFIKSERFDEGFVFWDENTCQYFRTSKTKPENDYEMHRECQDDYTVIGNIHDKEENHAD